MKCKKIMALALAGVLAVGMLAACGKSESKEELNTSTVASYLDGKTVTSKGAAKSVVYLRLSGLVGSGSAELPDGDVTIDKDEGTVEVYGFVTEAALASGEPITVDASGVELELGNVGTVSEYTGALCREVLKVMAEDCPDIRLSDTIDAAAMRENTLDGEGFWAIGIVMEIVTD